MNKSDSQDKNLSKKGSFDASKQPEKKETMTIERKNTAELGKKNSFVEDKPAPAQEGKAKPIGINFIQIYH